MSAPAISLHHPSPSHPLTSAPSLPGTWAITHSTLPLWRDKRTLTTTYALLPSHNGALDDLVSYRTPGSDKPSTVHGVDTPDAHTGGVWNWRGNGWLRVARSRWEVLGCGRFEVEMKATADGLAATEREVVSGEGRKGRVEEKEYGEWMVVFAQKSIFSAAGINVCVKYCDGEVVGLPEWLFKGIVDAMRGMGGEVGGLMSGLVEVRRD